MPAAPLEPRRPWEGKRIVLGVTGGIAAYKTIQVARDLTRLGGEVDVVLTQSAQKFVAPLTFEGVTGRPALTDLFSAEGAALRPWCPERPSTASTGTATPRAPRPRGSPTRPSS